MPLTRIFIVAFTLAGSLLSSAQTAPASSIANEVQSVYPSVQALYLDLHQHPELSLYETHTAAELADRLRKLGYEVTEHVGGTGVVAIMRNGNGPKVMLRTELDALPVEEKTGLPFSSKVHTKDEQGRDVPVMHACGHDIHMASLVGTAQIMAQTKNAWAGTLILVGQPAEERVLGAEHMLKDGLYTRFPKPDYAVALHSGNLLPAGMVGFTREFNHAAADSVRITLYGKGGHGAMPQTTVDPVLLGARVVVALQSIVAREIKPGEPAVITVGTFQSGTKNNIIPDEAVLALTVRSYSKETRQHLLNSIKRIANGESEAAGSPQPPKIETYEYTPAVYNDPALATRLSSVLASALGKDRVRAVPPQMVGEDFSYFTEAGVPGFYYDLGAADPAKFKEAQATGVSLPSNHSPFYAPDYEPALKTGIESEVAILRNLMPK